MFDFLKRYVKNPSKVGAIAPSGQGLTMKMMEPVDFEKAKCIVEYGPGTGVFTEELIRRKRPETALYIIERNIEFYRQIKEKYGELPKVRVICRDTNIASNKTILANGGVYVDTIHGEESGMNVNRYDIFL